jgi:hypothetical protein
MIIVYEDYIELLNKDNHRERISFPDINKEPVAFGPLVITNHALQKGKHMLSRKMSHKKLKKF